MNAEPTELEMKAAFAALLLVEQNNPFGCALKLFPNDMAKALNAAHKWVPEVDKYVADCIATASANEEHLPTKSELILLLWDRIQKATFADDVAKLTKQYLDARGWVEKPNSAPSVVVDNRRVMIVKDHGDDDQWEAKLQKQQADLTSKDFATRH